MFKKFKKNEAKSNGVIIAPIEPAKENDESEEWIWVEGYKGTEADMSCRGFRYELGKQFDIPEGEEIEECTNGFHLCLFLHDVYDYYSIGGGRRYFKVKALVRKADYERYGTCPELRTSVGCHIVPHRIDKIVAKSIEFVRELSIEEVLSAVPFDFTGWTDEWKELAMRTSIDVAKSIEFVRELSIEEVLSAVPSDFTGWTDE